MLTFRYSLSLPPLKMTVLSMYSLPGLTYPNPNLTRYRVRSVRDRPANPSVKLAAASSSNRCTSAGDFLRQLSVSSVFLIGVGLSSLWAFPHPALARISPASPSTSAQETLGMMNLVYFIPSLVQKFCFVGFILRLILVWMKMHFCLLCAAFIVP